MLNKKQLKKRIAFPLKLADFSFELWRCPDEQWIGKELLFQIKVIKEREVKELSRARAHEKKKRNKKTMGFVY